MEEPLPKPPLFQVTILDFISVISRWIDFFLLVGALHSTSQITGLLSWMAESARILMWDPDTEESRTMTLERQVRLRQSWRVMGDFHFTSVRKWTWPLLRIMLGSLRSHAIMKKSWRTFTVYSKRIASESTCLRKRFIFQRDSFRWKMGLSIKLRVK